MTAGSWPKPTPFDLQDGVDDEVLSLLFGGPDAELAGVLLLAAPGARANGWAARTAIALATAWTERSGTVILADASLESPELHGFLAEQNGEGVADVFQFGASLRRVRRTVEGYPFEFIPAGAYVLDPEGVMRHGAWSRLLEDTLSIGRRLMVYATAGAPGVDTLAERVGAVVLLAAADDEVDPEQFSADLRGVLQPSATGAAADAGARVAARRPDAEFERLRLPQGEARESHIADLRMQQRATVLGRPTEQADAAAGRTAPPLPTERVVPVEAASDLEQPVFPEPPERTRSGPGAMLLTLLVVLLFSLLAGAWHFWGREWLASRRDPAPIAPVDSSVATPALPVASGPVRPLPLSVAMEAYTSLPAALERQRALTAIEPEVGFLISPTLVDSTLYYRVFAGPMPDTAYADSVADQMVRNGLRSGRIDNDVHATPLAFLVAELETDSAARERQTELEQLDIPTYIVRIAAADGERFRVYAGAYSGRGEAEVMRQLLRNAGVQDSLVTRVGSSAQ